MVLTITTLTSLRGVESADDFWSWLLSLRSVQERLLQYGTAPTALGADVAAAEPAVAYVNHGRWVADCPTIGCPGAMDATPTLPFFCGQCLNVEIDFCWRPLLWPTARAEIEAALGLRLLPEQAHWRPPETVDDLRAENAARGIGVP